MSRTKMIAIYGINKYAGTKGDRKRIAEETGITSECLYKPKLFNERILKNYDPNWFITNPDEREMIENFNPTINITCSSCGKELGIDKIIDILFNG